jgi:hypothetical protein
MGKTGTTTLQHTLAVHRERLADAGILYPRSVFATHSANHNGLIGPFISIGSGVPRAFRQKEQDEPGSVARRGLALWNDIRAQMRACNPRVVILSGEYIFTQPEEVLVALRAALTRYFDDIQVIAYVRDPAAFYLSALQQKVRLSHVFIPPSRFEYPVRPCLTRHSRVFGDALSVKVFDRRRLRDRCIVRDFLSTFVPEATTIADSIDVVDVNESLSAEAMCIMERVRRYGWPDADDSLIVESELIMQSLKSDALSVPQTPARLRCDIEAEIALRFADDLEWLRERFGIVFDDAPSRREIMTEQDLSSFTELTEILDVDRRDVERVTAELLKSLSEELYAYQRSEARSLKGLVATLRRRAKRRLARVLSSRIRLVTARLLHAEQRAARSEQSVASSRTSRSFVESLVGPARRHGVRRRADRATGARDAKARGVRGTTAAR